MKQLTYQQGDVLFYRVDSLPLETQNKPDGIVAHGEATGHFHAIQGGKVFEGVEGVLFVDAPEGAIAIHQEHDPIHIGPGMFEIGIVREYDHFAEEARKVVD